MDTFCFSIGRGIVCSGGALLAVACVIAVWWLAYIVFECLKVPGLSNWKAGWVFGRIWKDFLNDTRRRYEAGEYSGDPEKAATVKSAMLAAFGDELRVPAPDPSSPHGGRTGAREVSRYSTGVLATAFASFSIAATLAWRGQVCMPTVFVIAAGFAAMVGGLMREEGL